MRINTNVSAINTHRALNQNNVAAARSIGRLSSGLRINRAADDAAGLAIANKFRADIRSLQVAHRNTIEATSMIQVAEGATTTVSDILARMKELATQAASANSADQLTTLDNEYQALVSEITRVVGAAQYQGTELLNTAAALTIQVGSGATAGVDTIDITRVDLSSLALGDLTTAANATTAMGQIDTAIGTVNSALASFGATQNRLDYAAANIATTIENYSASESAIRDADMAFEMTVFTRNQIMQQAATAMLAQANMAPQNVLRLLG